MELLNEHDIPCGPILSMKELAEEPSLRTTGTVVEVDHPKRGKYLTVGNPIKMSDSPTEVRRSPLLGEHTEEVLAELGYGPRTLPGSAPRRQFDRRSHREGTMSSDKNAVRRVLDQAKAADAHLPDCARGARDLRSLRHQRAARKAWRGARPKRASSRRRSASLSS